jgi:hypothetical protein
MLVCVFGSVHARARWISSSEVSCIAPAGGDKDEVNVSVSLNGIDHVQSTSSFQYMPEVSLVALQPSHGAARGGTTVRIEGSNFVFSSELACRFGISSVAARYINAGEVRCVTPPLEVGNVAVSVSNNGIDFSSSSLVYGRDRCDYIRVLASAMQYVWGVCGDVKWKRFYEFVLLGVPVRRDSCFEDGV